MWVQDSCSSSTAKNAVDAHTTEQMDAHSVALKRPSNAQNMPDVMLKCLNRVREQVYGPESRI